MADIELSSITGWGDYADTEYTSVSPFALSAGVDTEIPNNAQAGPRTQVPDDVELLGGFFVPTHIFVSSIVGTFQAGETITGGTSAATAVIVSVDLTNSRLFLQTLSGEFVNSETITGGTSGATATANGTRQSGVITGRAGDGLAVLIDFKARPTSAQTPRLELWIDIGGAVGELYRRTIPLVKGNGVQHGIQAPFVGYTLGTWETNGATILINSNEPAEIYDIRAVLTRTHKARPT